MLFFFFSCRRRHTRWNCDWSSDVFFRSFAASDPCRPWRTGCVHKWSPGGTRSWFPWHNGSLDWIGTSFCLLLSPCAKSAEPSGDRSRSEFARSRPAFHSAAHIDLKDHSVWFGPPTLYACPLPHAMEGLLRFVVEVLAPYTCGQ